MDETLRKSAEGLEDKSLAKLSLEGVTAAIFEEGGQDKRKRIFLQYPLRVRRT